MSERRLLAAGFGLWLSLAGGAAPAAAGGFEFFGQGSKAMGMANTFAAQADDPSAVYYNPAGLAFQKKKVTAGVAAFSLNESQFQGLSPGLGAGGTGEQESQLTFPPHLYVVKPLGPTLVLGLGAYSPFQLKTEWASPGAFPGRTLSISSELQSYDVATTVGWQATPNLGIGAGAVYRLSSLNQARRLQTNDPESGNLVDIATVGVETDFEGGAGWTAGLLWKVGKIGFGASYRSPIQVDYAGAGRLTQVLTGNAQLDQLVPLTLPLDRDLPLSTRVTFPASATVGLAFTASKTLTFELDANRTSWTDFDGLAVTFTSNPEFDDVIQGPWEDADSYRLGVRIGPPRGPQFRLGYALEESPVPDATLGPFLPDGERNVFAVGFGLDWLDIALQYIVANDRTTLTNEDDLNGTYSGNSYLLAISISK